MKTGLRLPDWMHGNEQHRGARAKILYFICWLVRADPDLLATCPVIDCFQIISRAVLLLAVAGVALFAWGAFLLLFFPWFIALPLLVPIMVWIVMIDSVMGSAKWKLTGILRRPSTRQFVFGWALILGLLADNATLCLRLGIAAVNSTATAYSATMAMSHDTIAAQEEKDRNEANATLRAKGESDKAQAWRNMLGADDAAVKEAAAALKALQQQIADARKNRESAASANADAQVNANCEMLGGPGCKRGRGPRYKEALLRSQHANAAMERAAADLAALEAQLPAAKDKYNDAIVAFHAREPDYLKAAQAVDQRLASETVPPRNDPVMAYRALQKIFQSEDGEATRFYLRLMLTLLLTVELSYVLASEYFSHANTHMPRLIARTRLLADETAEEYWRQRKTLTGEHDDPNPPRPSHQLLPRFGNDD